MMLDAGRVQAIFLAVLEQEPFADRPSILDRECAADEKLRRRVEALLIAHDNPDRLLDHSFIAYSQQVKPSPIDHEQLP